MAHIYNNKPPLLFEAAGVFVWAMIQIYMSIAGFMK